MITALLAGFIYNAINAVVVREISKTIHIYSSQEVFYRW